MASIVANLRSKISLAELQIQQFQRQSNSNEVRNINFTKAPLISSQNVSNFEIRVSKPQFHYDNVPTAVNQNWSVDMVQNVSRNVSLMNSRADSSQNSTNLNFYKSKCVKVDENAVHSVGDPKVSTHHLNIMTEKRETEDRIADEKASGKRQKTVQQPSDEDRDKNVRQGKQKKRLSFS
ncbi:uncharacterized protein LOC124900044 [Capsicum annuum]|uniref:uncharacterized protein LOC124900044 n=1 Tax=Capsicum annuum TaxID=4072 RepID=UPI001FB06411|nr:uncharacterized protein LOC124900044 [Capsicum annuum]XP_047271173.1 uncharacterized protein LOC124900044 [Capsicum annuum]